ncbi:hypothetical protein ASU81_21575 [Enterobacter hormaechei subsp. steigerwaltii]|nr:hypothetical protein ASU81_21575 [Enterobacter hormaechei subsp. steigerwaltii]
MFKHMFINANIMILFKILEEKKFSIWRRPWRSLSTGRNRAIYHTQDSSIFDHLYCNLLKLIILFVSLSLDVCLYGRVN